MPTPAYIRLDLFPAEVVDFPYTTRVVVTDTEWFFYVDSPEGPTAGLSGELYDFEGTNTRGYTIVSPDGTRHYVRRSGGCGCGSRLRGFRPFPGVPIQAR
jgi:hypothetical protein